MSSIGWDSSERHGFTSQEKGLGRCGNLGESEAQLMACGAMAAGRLDSSVGGNG